MVNGRELPGIKQIFEGIGRFQKTPEQAIQEKLRRLKQKNWKKELERVRFGGNLDRGEELVQSFVQGEIDVITALQQRHMIEEEYTVPNIILFHPKPNDYFSAKCETVVDRNRKGKIIKVSEKIYVNPSYIQQLAEYDPKKIIQMNGLGEYTEQGVPRDLTYSSGVEEAAHSVYDWNTARDIIGWQDLSDKTTLAEYDAHPTEYHGLGWRIRQIMDRKDLSEEMKEAILEPLRRRMQEAIKYRQALKPPKEKSAPIQAREKLKVIAKEK